MVPWKTWWQSQEAEADAAQPAYHHARRIAPRVRIALIPLGLAAVALLSPAWGLAVAVLIVLTTCFGVFVHVTATQSVMSSLRWARITTAMSVALAVLLAVALWLTSNPGTSPAAGSSSSAEVSPQMRTVAVEVASVLGTSSTAWESAAAGRSPEVLPANTSVLAPGPGRWWRISYRGESACMLPDQPQKVRRQCPVVAGMAD